MKHLLLTTLFFVIIALSTVASTVASAVASATIPDYTGTWRSVDCSEHFDIPTLDEHSFIYSFEGARGLPMDEFFPVGYSTPDRGCSWSGNYTILDCFVIVTGQRYQTKYVFEGTNKLTAYYPSSDICTYTKR
ncbi:MAG: hypothetical protein HQK49_00315 [Oligoflexia bacterium]|nr:hypothetical protein [Oligoflexia bacterium]